MATTVQAIIESAFAQSTASDSGKLAVDGELINQLNRDYQSYYAWSAARQPANALQAYASSTVTLSGSPASGALPADVIDIVRVEVLVVSGATAGDTVNLVPVAEKDRTWHLAPAVYRKGMNLVSLARSGDPVDTNTLKVYHADAPSALTTLASTLDARFPVRFEPLLVGKMAIYLSIKDEGRDPVRTAALKRKFGRDRLGIMRLIASSNTGASVVNPTTPALPAQAAAT